MAFSTDELYEVIILLKGNWSNDKFNGKGIYTYLDGSRYEVKLSFLLSVHF